jgi:single-strand DNA-binding protein
MPSINRVELMGNLGGVPEFFANDAGKRFAIISVATDQSYFDKKKNVKVEAVEWHKVVVYAEGLVKVIDSFCQKGTQVYLVGKKITRRVEKDGVTRYFVDIVLNDYEHKFIAISNLKTQADRTASAAEPHDDYVPPAAGEHSDMAA